MLFVRSHGRVVLIRSSDLLLALITSWHAYGVDYNGVIGKLVVVKDNSDGWLWSYKSTNWNDKAIKVKPGEAFTITKELGLVYHCFH